jgi:hypothetical protein
VLTFGCAVCLPLELWFNSHATLVLSIAVAHVGAGGA